MRRTRDMSPYHPRAAFSLIELMIGIIILGFGLTLVATMFPVAWQRARELSEYTSQRTLVAGAFAHLAVSLRVSGPDPTQNASSFMGDLLFAADDVDEIKYNAPIQACDGWPTDHWVHPLNMENLLVNAPQTFFAEDLWRLQDPDGSLEFALTELGGSTYGQPVIDRSFFSKQISFAQRVHPPMRTRKEVRQDGRIIGDDGRWDQVLNTRRFLWGGFYRFREPITFDISTPAERRDALAPTRMLDVYVVALRRPRPSARYAQQDARSAPNLCDLEARIVEPEARTGADDVFLPVPWRVQVEFPDTIVLNAASTGIPTEITVPPKLTPANAERKATIVQMFPPGTQFIDELSGHVFRVVNRRLVTPEGDEAVLTLHREVVVEDLDVPWVGDPPGLDPRCLLNAVGTLEDCELVRTVWVYPPSVEPRDDGEIELVFNGRSPVLDISIHTLTFSPRN